VSKSGKRRIVAQTLIQSDGLAPGCITRSKLNTTLAASAVVAKVLAGAGITLANTGVDAGTGDVTVTGLPSALPPNGWYLPAANTLGVATGGVQRGTISAAGNWTVQPPTTTTSTIGGYGLTVQAPNNGAASFGLLVLGGTNASDQALQVLNAAASADLFSVQGNGAISLPSVATTTAAPALGGAGALPLIPKGYFSLEIAGYAAKVPYY